MNLDRGYSGADYGQPLKSDWNSGDSWADCGHIHWELFWYRYCLFRGWGRVGSRDYRWCASNCAFRELSYGFDRACCSVPII